MADLASLADDVLAKILLGAPSPSDLARATASCGSFRRVVSSPRFLHRFRSLHPPPPLGVFCCPDGGADFQFHPAVPPHPSAPAARALARAADFSFAFLPPSYRPWLVRDYHDGRLLLDREADGSTAFTEVAVCDPLFRRYCLLPPIPGDLAASV